GWSVDVGEEKVIWSDEVAAIHDMPPGYSPSVEEGINFYVPEYRKRIADIFSNCLKFGIAFDEEMEIITATGRRVWVRTLGDAIFDASGRVSRVEGGFQDISELKKIEEERERYVKELEVFRKASVGREERILDLKRELSDLKDELKKSKGGQ
nr:PAS domain-containing protein [Candidatus Omnitrophota bacterium]